MKRLCLFLALAGCAHQAKLTPVHRVGFPAMPGHVLAPQACAIPSPPSYPDTPAALAAAPGLIGRDLLIAKGKAARDAYEARVATAKHACG